MFNKTLINVYKFQVYEECDIKLQNEKILLYVILYIVLAVTIFITMFTQVLF